MRRIALAAGMALGLAIGACGRSGTDYRPVAAGTVGNTSVTISTPDGTLDREANRIEISFTDVDGHRKQVKEPALVLTFGTGNVPPVETNTNVPIMPALAHVDTGVYRAVAAMPIPGEWAITVAWHDEQGPKEWQFTQPIP